VRIGGSPATVRGGRKLHSKPLFDIMLEGKVGVSRLIPQARILAGKKNRKLSSRKRRCIFICIKPSRAKFIFAKNHKRGGYDEFQIVESCQRFYTY
jgi:hypothetical protein